MATLSVLEREMFSEAEAARLLRVPQSTLHYWLDGGEHRRKTYKPVIRLSLGATGSVTWAEFVEAGLLREYRRTHGVPMAELRTFIDLLRRSSVSLIPWLIESPSSARAASSSSRRKTLPASTRTTAWSPSPAAS